MRGPPNCPPNTSLVPYDEDSVAEKGMGHRPLFWVTCCDCNVKTLHHAVHYKDRPACVAAGHETTEGIDQRYVCQCAMCQFMDKE